MAFSYWSISWSTCHFLAVEVGVEGVSIILAILLPRASAGLMDFQKDFAGKVLTIDFEVNGQVFTAINAGDEFKFTEAVSFLIYCKDQEEIDYYWNEFTKNGGEESVCGRCKDKYGMNRQINPENMAELMNKPDAYGKLMNMKKIIISEF